MSKRLPPLLPLIPESVSVEDFVGHSGWELSAAASRAAKCALCPPQGGACESDIGYYAEGMRPTWDEGTLSPAPCERWAPYAVYRELVRAGVPRDEVRGWTFEHYGPRHPSQELALNYMQLVARQADPRTRVLITGETGLGKSHLAAATLRAFVGRRSVMYGYVPDLVDQIRREMFDSSTETIDRARKVDFLVLDDIGAERTTDFVREKIEIILNARVKRATICTTNISLDHLADEIGDPIVRRALQGTRTLALEGEPYTVLPT